MYDSTDPEMRSRKKHLQWQIGYAVCCLVYVIWVVCLSRNNFEMVHGDYRRAGERLQPERIEEVALQELVDQCLKQSRQIDALRSVDDMILSAEDACFSWSAEVREERQQVVARRLLDERSRYSRKLVLFYISFVVFFLILPPVLLYLLLSGFMWIFRTTRSPD